MSSIYNAGYPCFVDGAYYTAALWRQFDGGVSVFDAGTASAVAPAGGVFGAGSMTVTAGTGMAVTVAAGYCSVPSSTSGQGAYRFGLMTSASLTVAANSTGSTRKDYVLANVQDLHTTGSYAQVEYVTGTTSFPAIPVNSIVLAQVQVPNGATSIVSGDITDVRTQVVPPGCLIPISSLTSAPAVPTGQLMYLTTTGHLIYSPYTVVSETLTGTGNWDTPNGVLGGTINAQAFGAGAGGTSQGSSGSGAGAGAGEWSCEPDLEVAEGGSYPYSCGTGGIGGASGRNATTGTATTLAGESVTLTANGGQIVAGSQAGGLGGTDSTNTLHNPGGSGGNGDSGDDGFGGGGGAAGSPLGPGADGTSATSTAAGDGGIGQDNAGSGGDGGSLGGYVSYYGSGGYAENLAQPGVFPGGAGAGAGTAGEPGADGADGCIILSYIVAPGASPYPIAGSADYWYAQETTVTEFGSMSVQIEADGVSDYRIAVGAASVVPAAGYGSRVAALQILADGYQLDSISTVPTSSSVVPKSGWRYFTSGAQGTTLSAGTHTITFAASQAKLAGPAFVRVDQVLA